MLLYICRCIYLLYVDGGTWSAIYVWESCRASFIIIIIIFSLVPVYQVPLLVCNIYTMSL
jgi:hypothetical protein